jgi:hypothetical protein
LRINFMNRTRHRGDAMLAAHPFHFEFSHGDPSFKT